MTTKEKLDKMRGLSPIVFHAIPLFDEDGELLYKTIVYAIWHCHRGGDGFQSSIPPGHRPSLREVIEEMWDYVVTLDYSKYHIIAPDGRYTLSASMDWVKIGEV